MERRPHLIPALIATVLLLGASENWPYIYYQLLRFVTCGVAVYIAFAAFNWQKVWGTWLFGLVAVLFNPLFPIYLSPETWQMVDTACALLFFAAALILKKPVTKMAEQ